MLAFAAGAVVLFASLLNLLLFHDYPILSAEVALLTLAIIAIAAAMVPIYLRQPRLVKSLLAALLVFIAVDLNSDSLVAGLVLALVTAAASWKMGAELLRFLAVLAGVATITSALGLTQRTNAVSVAKAEEQRPALQDPGRLLVVHIIMDSMGGIAGLRESKATPSQFAEDVGKDLVDAGFDVEALAYSPWPNTVRAIPSALNYDGRPNAEGSVKDGGRTGRLELLGDLRDRGYRTKLWQTSYLDFCTANAVAECVTTNINHLQILRETGLPPSDRAVIIGANLISQSRLGRRFVDGIDMASRKWGLTGANGAFPPMIMERRHIGAVHAERTLRTLAGELRTAEPGTAYVAHILFPHYPYVYDSNCALRRFRDWEPPWYRRPLEERWKRYEQQYRCALRRLDEIVSAVDSSPARANSMIIVHGDHGPRIRQTTLSRDPSIERTLFSTLFAVRRSGGQGSMIDRQCPVGTLLDSTMRGKPVAECPRNYFLENGKGFVARPISDWSLPMKGRYRAH